MRDKYFPPKFNEDQFHCIHCGVFAHQDWFDKYALHSGQPGVTGVRLSDCSHRHEWSFWYEEKMIIPAEAPVEPPHPDLPETCKLDYLINNAISILDDTCAIY